MDHFRLYFIFSIFIDLRLQSNGFVLDQTMHPDVEFDGIVLRSRAIFHSKMDHPEEISGLYFIDGNDGGFAHFVQPNGRQINNQIRKRGFPRH